MNQLSVFKLTLSSTCLALSLKAWEDESLSSGMNVSEQWISSSVLAGWALVEASGVVEDDPARDVLAAVDEGNESVIVDWVAGTCTFDIQVNQRFFEW